MLAARIDGMDRQQLRELADSLRNKWKSAVVVLASAGERRRLDRFRGHQRSHGQSSRGQAGGRGGAGGRAAKAAAGPIWPKAAARMLAALDAALEAVYREVESKL